MIFLFINLKKAHIETTVGRGFLFLCFMKTPYIAYPVFSMFLPPTLLFRCLISFAKCVIGPHLRYCL